MLYAGMAPHDLWESNPVCSLDFFNAYEDLLRLIGFREISDEEEEVNIPPLVEDSDTETDYDTDSRELMQYDSDTSVETEYEDWGDDLDELPTLADFARND